MSHWAEIDKNNKVVSIDIKNKVYKFNGSEFLHWTDKYEGNRWSLVFFTNHTRQELDKLKNKKLNIN